MSERDFSKREADDELEWLSSIDELDEYLAHIAPFIGWITIYFNSLEDHITDFIRMAVLRDPFQDERLDVFLSGMMFSAKAQALIELYGQLIALGGCEKTDEDLKNLQKLLQQCAERRNEYAHADWIGVRKGNFVRVKSISRRSGVIHRYRVFEDAKLEADVAFIRDARFTLTEFNDAMQEQMWRSTR